VENRIKKWLAEYGFSLEARVLKILRKSGWNVLTHPSYVDPESGKEREVDFLITKFEDVNTYRFGIEVFIECRKSSKPWIFYMESKIHDRAFTPSSLILLKTCPPPIGENLEIIESMGIRSHYSAKKYSEYASMGRVALGEKDELFECVMSVVKATHNELERRSFFEFPKKEKKLIVVIYPAIVVEGEILSGREPSFKSIEKTSYIQYLVNRLREIFLIDIMKENFLPDYISLLDAEFNIMKATLHKVS
jgi:hypothetical protein